jgi:ATPase subunit of ABC transporter with duplicated ATPase domains
MAGGSFIGKSRTQKGGDDSTTERGQVLLTGQHLSKNFPTKDVFSDVTIGIHAGDRIGIVGQNGEGKSTLLKLLVGRISPDSGQVTMNSGLTIGYLDQADGALLSSATDDRIISDVVLGQYEYEYEWASDSRIRSILDGLLSDLDLNQKVNTLSGGQAQRVQLAALLTGDWDILALDEPTNHLDIGAITWLASHIKKRWQKNDGAFLVVTHDRWFLDEVANMTFEVHDGVIDSYEGGYAAYILARVERGRQAAQIEAKRQNLMKKELAWLRRGAPARTSKPKFRIEAANELIEDVPEPRNQTELVKLATSRLGKQVVDAIDVSVSFDKTPVLNDITWLIGPGDRFGILGANGAGKSTLLSVITGQLAPTLGRVKIGKTVKFATLTQRLDELSQYEDMRVREVVAEFRTTYQTGDKELTPGQMLERLGFATAQLQTYVRDLSGGQRRRLQLLLILLNEPNVLILDEPSNDLDTDMLATLEDLLDWWPGTLLVVSHDRYLVERVTDQQFALVDGKLRHMPGGVDEFLQLTGVTKAPKTAKVDKSSSSSSKSRTRTRTTPIPMPSTSRTASRDDSSSASNSSDVPAKDTVSVNGGLSAGELYNRKKEIAAAERKLDKLLQERRSLEDRLESADQSNYILLGEIQNALNSLQEQIDEQELLWLELSS